MTPQRLAALTALLGAAVVAAGMGLVYPPAGVIVAGLAIVALAYAAFVGAR